ncbi:MAG: PfkB family carbohydrate kinase [Candidatus Uhrbacteria bacterium]|nr:PfkB family carbohydrate kinase [Candidatus Uhrbacteria bacterium]
MYDIITIGAATRDVFLVSNKFIAIKSKKFLTGMGECVALGSKIEIDRLVLTTGGGATNAAATFGSLGFHTATICRVGDDSPGKDVVEDLSRFGVSTHLVRQIKGGATAYSTILTMKDGERTVLVYRGTSADFVTRDIPISAITNTKWIYLTSLGGNLALAKKIIQTAHKAGVKIAWNPGHKELEEGLRAFSPLLPMINVLNINLEEATLLTGKKKLMDIFKSLHSDGLVRLVTDGTNGATVSRDGWIAHAATTGVKSISRTGAGDAFGSGFVAGLIKTEDLHEALRVGMINAESVITKYGAKNGILTSWPSSLKKRKVKIVDL